MMRTAIISNALLIMLASVQSANASPVASPHLAPHRAVYNLSMKHAEARSGLNDVRGKLVLEVAGSSCEGWTSNMRVVNRLDARVGRVSTLDTRSTAWESGSGDSMEFATQRLVNGEQELDLRGRAQRGPDGGQVLIEMPEEAQILLPPGTIFPVEHTRRILSAAIRGESRDSSRIYDGNEEQQVLTAISFIGKRSAPDTVTIPETAKGAEGLVKLASWPISIGYFKDGLSDKQVTEGDTEPDGEQMPEHQVSFTMFENAVAANLTLDYGDFALKGDLVELDYLPQEKCNPQK